MEAFSPGQPRHEEDLEAAVAAVPLPAPPPRAAPGVPSDRQRPPSPAERRAERKAAHKAQQQLMWRRVDQFRGDFAPWWDRCSDALFFGPGGYRAIEEGGG